MSLTLANLRQLQSDFLSTDLDNYRGQSPTTADQDVQINWALRTISRRLVMFNESVTLTLVNGTAKYDLRDTATPVVSQRVVFPFVVVINGTPLSDRYARDYGLWSFNEFSRQLSTFRTDAAGVPTAATWIGNNGGASLILNPKPNATVVSNGNNFVGGQVLAATLTSGTDIPGIPEECHEGVAVLAAIYAATPMATEQEAWQRLQQFGQYSTPVDDNRMDNLRWLKSWGTSNTGLKMWLTEVEDAANSGKS